MLPPHPLLLVEALSPHPCIIYLNHPLHHPPVPSIHICHDQCIAIHPHPMATQSHQVRSPIHLLTSPPAYDSYPITRSLALKTMKTPPHGHASTAIITTITQQLPPAPILDGSPPLACIDSHSHDYPPIDGLPSPPAYINGHDHDHYLTCGHHQHQHLMATRSSTRWMASTSVC